MKHRFPVPYLDGGDLPDISSWARSRGWHVAEYTWSNNRFGFRADTRAVLTVTLVPFLGVFPDHGVKVTAASGATLIYDDADRSMAVTLQSEPQDAIPEDARRMRT